MRLVAVLLLALFVGVLSFSVGVLTTPADPVNSCVMVYNASGHGSGAIIDAHTVLTAKHVAHNPGLTVRTNDGDEYRVVSVIEDPDSDAALLVVDGEFDEPPLTLSERRLVAGDSVTLIGTPYGVENQNCRAVGEVLKVDVTWLVEGTVVSNLDLHCAHYGPGCSGGPLLYRGRIVGIAVAGCDMVGGALPTEEFRKDLGL